MIKLSKKWDYALKAIIYISKHKDELLKIAEISQKLTIPEAFLRRIINDFEKSWILKTIKWRNWGVLFEKELNEINLYDILNTVWEDLNIANCTSWHICNKEDVCLTTNVFKWLQKWFNWLLKLYSLDKIIKNDN